MFFIYFETLSFTEIDPCKINLGGCQQRCVNHGGKAICSCHSGYELSIDGKTCTGEKSLYLSVVFETPRRGYSMFSVVDTIYTTSTSNSIYSCSDINECSLDDGGCSQGCANTRGSYTCICKPGYQLGTDDKTCYSETKFNANSIFQLFIIVNLL